MHKWLWLAAGSGALVHHATFSIDTRAIYIANFDSNNFTTFTALIRLRDEGFSERRRHLADILHHCPIEQQLQSLDQ
jgi:hypothetical protein